MSRSEVLNDEQVQAGWYESSLPSAERKKRGHYSTPLPLVERILDACGYTPDADLTRIRVLDPACGSGNFLAGAARRLLASSRRLDFTQSEQARLLTRNIWGFDPDPVSCFLTQMQLSSRLGEEGFIEPSSPVETQTTGRDELRPYDGSRHIQQYDGSRHIQQYNGDWHVHQADSLALPWEPCVDLFLANPPYLAAKNADLSGYRSALQRGQADSYLLFLSLAMQVVRPGGWIGLVLPDPMLARLNAARERAQLLRQMTLHHLWHLSDVFAAEVGAVVLIAQNLPPTPAHQVAWVRSRWQPSESIPATKPLEARQTPQALLRRQPAAELRYLLSSENGALLDQLRMVLEHAAKGDRKLAPLGEFVTVSRGEELGRESPFITRDVEAPAGGNAYVALAEGRHVGTEGDASVPAPPIIHPRPYNRGLPLLRGGIDIRPFATPRAEWRIDHEAVTKPMQRYLTPKLLVVKSTDRLQATLDTRGHVALQTLYLLQIRGRGEQCGQQMPEERVDLLYFFLGLLNSQLLRDYVYILHTAYKWVQPQIEQRVLASLPVPLVGREEQAEIVRRAKQLERACSKAGAVVEWDEETGALYEALERTIRAIYMSALHPTY